jgi:peptide/nickel transport system substrate-binding protein
MSQSYWSKFTTARTNRRRLLLRGGGASLGLAALATIGCGDDDDDDDSAGGASGGTSSPSATSAPSGSPSGSGGGGGPQQGGRFGRYFGTGPANFNQLLDTAEGSWFSGLHVYDRLISSRVQGDPYVLEAAEGFEQPDDLTLTFKLRPGMVYQDRAPVSGRDVKASDVVGTQLLAKGLDGADNPFQRNSLDTIEAPDDLTIVMHLQAPNAYLFTGRQLGTPTSQAIIPEELHDSMSAEGPEWPIGSGPYELAEASFGSSHLFRRFEKFRGAADKLPYTDEREVFVLTDPVALETAFRGEQIHRWQPALTTVDQSAQELSDMAEPLEQFSLSAITWVLCMFKNPARGAWVTDQRIREGFYRATDREQVIQLYAAGKAVAPSGILSQAQNELYLLDYDETEEFFKFDPAEGKKLMEAASFTGKEVEGMAGGGPTGLQLAEILQRQFSEVGVQLNPLSVTLAELVDKSLKGNYDFYIGGHPAYDSPQVPMRQNHSDSRSQFANSGLGDPVTDALIEKAEQTLDFEERAAIIKEAQLELLKRYGSYYNLYTATNTLLLNKKVHDFNYDPADSAGVLYQLEMWMDT